MALQLKPGPESPLYLEKPSCTIRALFFTVRSNTNMKTTVSAKPETVKHDWYVVDAAGFTPHVDTGDYIVVVNADKIQVTGNKASGKKYYDYSGFIGGMKETSFEQLLADHPERVIERAVKGMMPKNALGRAMMAKLKIYAGPEHKHSAQQPKPLDL